MNHYAAYALSVLNHQESCIPSTNLRIKVLRETIEAFSKPNNYIHIALNNLHSWHKPPSKHTHIIVEPLDWGDATLKYTKQFGHQFCVLNMANPHYPGGGYLYGCVAQEENMFRRSDCHFSISNNDWCYHDKRYKHHLTALLSAQHNKVYIDHHPRVCIRSSEANNYSWLPFDEIFPFTELRASAQNCLYQPFNKLEAHKRISAQFETLKNNNIKYVVLGAFGCGSFNNPSYEIAAIYKKHINYYKHYFNAIIFAIYDVGYGSDNYSIFKEILQ